MSASGKKRSRLNLRAEPLPPRLEQATPPESQNTRSSLVLSIDVGTSTSAVTTHHWVSTQSYESETNDEPDPSNKVSRAIVTNIASWPGHEGSSFYEEKVPSLLIYDNDGKLMACGAIAASRTTEIEAIEKGWTYVENFKILLHPPSILQKLEIPSDPFPPNVDLLTVYKDFLSYLLAHTRRHLRDTTGRDPWPGPGEEAAHIVLPHPNGWGEVQQRFLRDAAVAAGLVSQDKAKTNIHFVEEAEASISYFLNTRTATTEQLSAGSKFLICDAGGSTTDMAAYEVKAKLPAGFSLKELGLPSCVGAGGAHVDILLKSFLTTALSLAAESDPPPVEYEEIFEYVLDGLRDFRHSGKRSFHSPRETYAVDLSQRRLNSITPPIKRGRLTLEGPQMEALFIPSVDKVAAEACRRISETNCTLIILTGGFGGNAYVKRAIENVVGGQVRVIIANSRISKAVVVGSLWLLTDGPNRVTVERNKRTWNTMLANIARGFRTLLGRNHA